ncbi:hypothetical protein [Thauera humireducens]|nr:hypothetical protein [Thauera humireducens]
MNPPELAATSVRAFVIGRLAEAAGATGCLPGLLDVFKAKGC